MLRELSRGLLKAYVLQIASDGCRRNKMTQPLCASMQQKILAGTNLRAESMERAGLSNLILVFTVLLGRVATLAA